MLPYGRQWIDEDDIKAVVEVLRSDWLTQGPKVEEFEKAMAEYCGAKYAVVVSSGTAALHLACLVAGIKQGDEAITSPITFVASANCVLYCGGKPVFADIDKDTYNIDPAEIKKKITKKTRAIIPVHFAGLPCDMGAIKKIAEEYDLIIIEDACHALGAEYRIQDSGLRTKEEWIKVGSCSHSDMAVFSFHPVQHITTGEGGAVLTNNEKFYEKLLSFRNHGITKDPEKFTNKDLAFPLSSEPLIHNPNPWYYEMQELGFNHRITDIQCALGTSQLRKLDSFISRRRKIVSIYNQALGDMRLIKIPVEPKTKNSACHLYPVQMDFEKLGKSRFKVMAELKEKGIGTQVHYIPVHLQPYYRRRLGFRQGDYPAAEEYYNKALSLPLYPGMRDKDITKVINSVEECANVK